jgi:hypothetical protein
MSVSNIERETIILFNEAEDTVSVYTFNPTLKRKLGDFSEKYPALCKKTAEDSLGSVTYSVAKDRLSISLRAPISEEKKEALRERGKKLFERLKEKQSSEER